MPSSTVTEGSLTEEQIKIIESEKKRIDNDNFVQGWLGYKNGTGWDFMRHGFEVIHIDEDRANVARKNLQQIIHEKYGEEESQKN
jgi:hypothetical protein